MSLGPRERVGFDDFKNLELRIWLHRALIISQMTPLFAECMQVAR